MVSPDVIRKLPSIREKKVAHPLDRQTDPNIADHYVERRNRDADLASPVDGGLPLSAYYTERLRSTMAVSKATGADVEQLGDLPPEIFVNNHHSYSLVYPKPPRRIRIRGSVTLDASGNGTVRFGPVPPGQHWLIERITVRCSTLIAPVPVFTVYTQSVADANAVDTTVAGNLDTSDNSNPVMVEPGEEVIGVWASGVVGAIASWNVQYRVEIGGEVTTP